MIDGIVRWGRRAGAGEARGLTATSLATTLGLGLPYSSSLVYPLVVGVAGVMTRTAA